MSGLNRLTQSIVPQLYFPLTFIPMICFILLTTVTIKSPVYLLFQPPTSSNLIFWTPKHPRYHYRRALVALSKMVQPTRTHHALHHNLFNLKINFDTNIKLQLDMSISQLVVSKHNWINSDLYPLCTLSSYPHFYEILIPETKYTSVRFYCLFKLFQNDNNNNLFYCESGLQLRHPWIHDGRLCTNLCTYHIFKNKKFHWRIYITMI